MHEFAEEYVANLSPRDERYDTRLGDDFYVATFPNGIKTWVYLYQVNGYTRRQTLGIYPQMPLEQALESLYAARHTRAVETELADGGFDGSQVRHTEASPINLTTKLKLPQFKLPFTERLFLAGAVTGVVLGLAAALGVWMVAGSLPVAEDSNQLATADSLQPVVAPAPEPPVEALANPPAEPVPEPPAAPTSVAEIETVDDSPDALPDQSDTPPEMSESQLALRQLQEELAGTLASAQLTSEILDGEPVDHLSWVVELTHAPRQVFYYVRVRGMAGSTVTYRWSYRGKLIKEDSVVVGKGWHSPAYSRMTLTNDRLGLWQVELVGADGQSLGSEEFETRLAKDGPRLSKR